MKLEGKSIENHPGVLKYVQKTLANSYLDLDLMHVTVYRCSSACAQIVRPKPSNDCGIKLGADLPRRLHGRPVKGAL